MDMDDARPSEIGESSVPISPNKQTKRRPLHVSNDDDDSVRVAIRVRPLLAMESGNGRCLVCQSPTSLQLGGSKGPRFTYDQVWDSATSQTTVFGHPVVDNLLEACLQGYNATVLAYGQTGSGKTYTMLGEDGKKGNDRDEDDTGIVPRALRRLFRQVSQDDEKAAALDPEHLEAVVSLQFLEIYGDDIRDLLVSGLDPSSCTNNGILSKSHHRDKLTIRELGGKEPEVVGATRLRVRSAAAALEQLRHGMMRRVTASTAMNMSSSRSHAILSVFMERSVDGTRRRSKFNFVDLAGSERLKRTLAQGARMKEGIDINKGLLVLGNVIAALGDPQRQGKTFVPYRDSKLTRLLKGSLGGNHKTLMIACVSPSESNMEESLNCLRYANRAKNIQNKAVMNVDENSLLIADLQEKVRVLATTLLQSIDGADVLRDGPLSRNDINSMAGTPMLPASGLANSSSSVFEEEIPNIETAVSMRTEELELEVVKLRDDLRQVRSHQEEAEEELYTTKAEKELVQLQLSLSLDGHSRDPATGDDQKGKETDAFLERAKVYEKEISQLQHALREAERKINTMSFTDGNVSSEFVAKEALQLEQDRHRWRKLQTKFLNEYDTEGHEPNTEGTDELDLLTKHYLNSTKDDEEEELLLSRSDETNMPLDAEVDADGEGERSHLRTDILELAKSIAAKEELIDQLKLSEEKYSNMREFYEEKVRQMETTLHQKEADRDNLLRKLRHLKSGDAAASRQLENKLQEKERHIASLKVKHRQLVDLTAVSTRNQTKIANLQADVTDMKKKKVDLQKIITRERKDHANELRRLQKDSIRKDVELSKVKKASARRQIEAERASQMAKSRLQELGKVKEKYKTAEKKLRLLSVSRGVMTKAGIDPVLVGRRANVGKGKAKEIKSTSPDADLLRSHFDEKVAEVVKKDDLVNKLATAWEDHYQLVSRLENDPALVSDEEDRQATNIQLRYKEDRIRKLASRLGRSKPRLQASSEESRNGYEDTFFFDQTFSNIVKGMCTTMKFAFSHALTPSEDLDSVAASSLVARVLFGMVVREKRRIAALARTASSLDERLQAAEKDASVSESAFRSFVDEHSEEVVKESRNQHDQILSLMRMVEEESQTSDQKRAASDTLEILARERIIVLEKHIRDLQGRLSASDSFRTKTEELGRSLRAKSDELEDARDELGDLRSLLRRIKATAEVSDAPSSSLIAQLAKEALHVTPSSPSKECAVSSPDRLNEIESDDEGDVPEWAADIMEDLALIAEGKLPPSIEHTVTIEKSSGQTEKLGSARRGSVFDRLSDPQRFTGTAHATLRQVVSPTKVEAHSQDDRKAMSQEISLRLENIVIPGEDDIEPAQYVPRSNRSTNGKTRKSVFERLVSPSHFTGTHKDKHEAMSAKRLETADEAATRILDDILAPDDSETSYEEEQPTHTHMMYDSYTRLNVFERLQKTTTQAYAGKGTAPPSPRRDERRAFVPPDDVEPLPLDRLSKTTEIGKRHTRKHRET